MKSNENAGKGMICEFMEQHPKLSFRFPEATRFGRSTSFNKTNVAAFHKNLNLYE